MLRIPQGLPRNIAWRMRGRHSGQTALYCAAEKWGSQREPDCSSVWSQRWHCGAWRLWPHDRKDRDAMSVLSMTLLSWMNPSRRKAQEERLGYFRTWWASTRNDFKTLGYCLWGPLLIARWLTFAGHLARMGDLGLRRTCWTSGPFSSRENVKPSCATTEEAETRCVTTAEEYALACGRHSRSRSATAGRMRTKRRKGCHGRGLLWTVTRGGMRFENACPA